jgi:Na+/melibiose symporter-like transporter
VSAKSVRVWALATLTTVSAVAVAYSINKLTADPHEWWWWLVVGAASLVGVIAGVWTTLGAMRGGRDTAVEARAQSDRLGSAATPATGATISITADNSSAAAWQMGDVTIGQPPKRGKRKRS